MKTFATIMKVLAVLAAIAGIIFVVATYGERLVAWAKNLLAKLRREDCFCCDEDCCCCDEDYDDELAEGEDFEG